MYRSFFYVIPKTARRYRFTFFSYLEFIKFEKVCLIRHAGTERVNFVFYSHPHAHHTQTLKLGYLSKYRPTTVKNTFNELPRG